MKTTKIILLAMLISIGLNIIAQVAINDDGTEPDESAMLDVKSNNKGVLFPRLTQTEIALIANPANGLTVFNTDDNRFYFYDDGAGEWKEVAIGSGTITPYIFSCGDPLVDSRDSKSYTTVQIGTQCWMAENLYYETTNSWWHDNSSANGNIYGRLYTWDAALTACPSGWSLPSDDQWKQIEMALGMSQSEADNAGWRGTDEGGKMKETGYAHWYSPNLGATNTSGFTALPGGYRSPSGSFGLLGYYSYYWSSSESSGTGSRARFLYYNSDQVHRSSYSKTNSFSVRCIKD